MEAKEEENIEEKMEEEAKLDADKNGEEEWVTVTPKCNFNIFPISILTLHPHF
jgi:hypothetical protein